MSQTLMATYKRLPVTFAKGQGAWLWDEQGKAYLDALTGVAVCSLGHAHPAVTKAICDQAATLVHTSNHYGIAKQQALADRLCALSGMDRVFFCNSGAEANEAAIKLARLHGHARGIEVPVVLVMEQSFHGRTLATLTATGNRRVQAGFEPLVQGFVRLPYGDLDALQRAAEQRSDICAVLVEPVQGEGGVRIPSDDYLPGIRRLCTERGWLMMLDEIQTGMGRTGVLFAHQALEDARPDVMTLAKALGNGVPIGACLAAGPATELFGPGSHGSTFGGNPLACAAALAVLEVMEQGAIPAQAAATGQALLARLKAELGAELGAKQGVLDIRGRGMILGIELDRPCAELSTLALEQGLLINVTADRVVRLLPPLNLSADEADTLVTGLVRLIRNFLANGS